MTILSHWGLSARCQPPLATGQTEGTRIDSIPNAEHYCRDGHATLVAVHVRLGDYLSSDTHAPLPPSYYHEALKLMREKFDDPVFLIFSDEPEKMTSYLDWGVDAVIMPRLDQFQSLGLMQSCQAFIIANSTFSWWAAWLSDSPDVICPDRFFADREWQICPSRWTHLPRSSPPLVY